MRLWTVHPKYLDAKGLVALWRETLLAQAVLRGLTKGYKHHPQLLRFQATSRPAAAVAAYLVVVHQEAERRGYHFDGSKIGRERFRGKITETNGQLLYEWEHLKRKLRVRDPERLRSQAGIEVPEHHPMFKIISGPVREWEKVEGKSPLKTLDKSTASA